MLLRDLRDRGMQAPVLAVGDGALGFWGALSEVFPTTLEQRCWFHKLGNILDKLPQSMQSEGKSALHEIVNAPTGTEALKAIKAFTADFGVKYPKAVECLTKDQVALLAFFDFPAEHWKHLRTTNPIESTFATVRLRRRVTKGLARASPALPWCSSCCSRPRRTGASGAAPSSSRSCVQACIGHATLIMSPT